MPYVRKSGRDRQLLATDRDAIQSNVPQSIAKFLT